MASEPIILTKNYINSAASFSVSSGGGNISLAYDRDKNSQWSSSGAASDSTPVTIQVTLAASTTFDSFILINHNVKSYIVQYWTGSAWSTFITNTTDASQSATFNASQYGNLPSAIAAFSAVTTTQILISLYSTQIANQEKVIGEIVCAAVQINPLQDMAVYEVKPRVKQKVKILGDGSIQYATVFWSPTQSQKYEAQITWKNLPYTQLASFQTLKQSGLPFLWYPESITRPDDIYYVNWDDAIQWKYSAFYKFAGIEITLYLREV